MSILNLSIGTVDTSNQEYIDFITTCFPIKGATATKPGVPVFDKIEASAAILGFYRWLGLDLVFRTQKRGKGEWRYWTGKCWELYPDYDFTMDLLTLLGGRMDDKVTTSILNMVADRSPIKHGLFDQTEVIAFDNCALYRKGQEIDTKPHNRDDYSTFHIPFPIGKSPCPKWEKFVEERLPDINDRLALQEMYGYCLFPSYQGQVMFILHGPPNAGKGTLVEPLNIIIGRKRVTGVRMDTLGDTHGLAPLVGAYVNFDPETHYLSKAGENILKFITGGGSITVNEKYEKQITTPLTVRIIMSCNTIPKFNDKTDALWQRIVVVPFENVVDGAESREMGTIMAELTPEMPGIVWWALKGLRRLLKNGRTRSGAFTQSDRAKQILESHRKASDHFLDWYDTFVEIGDPDDKVQHTEAFQHYCTWIRRCGYESTGKDGFITSMARKKHPCRKLGPKQSGDGKSNEKRKFHYEGIRLLPLEDE